MSQPIDELGIALSSGNTEYINWASGNGGTTGGTTAPSGSTGTGSADYYKQMFEAQQADARQTAGSYLRDLLSQYGLGDLAGEVDGMVQQWGTNAGVLVEKIRDTGAYKTRFAGLVGLRARGVTDVASEAQYLQLESQYRTVFRDAGLTSYVGDAGSKAEQAAIAKLVGEYSLSVNEVKQRVDDASRVVNNATNPEVLSQFQKFYNVQPSDLVAQALNIKNSTERINQMANAAVAGAAAKGYGLDATSGTAEQIAQMTAGNGDLNGAQLNPQLSQAADVYRNTVRLAQIEQSDLSTEDALQNEFQLSPDATAKVKGLQSRERARFSGTSGISSGSLSRTSGV